MRISDWSSDVCSSDLQKTFWTALAAVAATFVLGLPAQAQDAQSLLNVSYDPTRELYRAVDAAFAKAYRAGSGTELTIRQSHGGSGKQIGKASGRVRGCQYV